MDFWNDKDQEYRLKMIDVYNEQIKYLTKIVPTFKMANATIHFDETSPHMHIVGVPVVENCTRGMKKQLDKNAEKLVEVNNQTEKLDNSSKDINSILDKLKPSKLNKNNNLISNEDIDKLKKEKIEQKNFA